MRALLSNLVRQRRLAVGLALIALIAGVCAANPSFASFGNFRDLLVQSAPVVIVGCAMTFVVLTGEIDISAGSLLGLLAALMGLLASPTHLGLPAPAVAAITLLAGAAVGLASGLLVTIGRVPSIVATLGMLTILRGITELLLAGHWITDLPPSIRILGTGTIVGVPVCVLVAAIIAGASLFVARCTPVGVRIFAVGGNPEAAAISRISVTRIKLFAFALVGLLTGVAALVCVPQQSVIEPGIGIGFELVVVTAVVVGGTSIRGGVGGIAGTVLAALLLGSIRTALVFLNIGETATFWERAIQGAFMLAVVLADHFAGTASDRRSAKTRRGPRVTTTTSAPARAIIGLHGGVLLFLLIAVCGVAAWLEPAFALPRTQLEISTHAFEIALLALPMTLIIISGGIDLSVGSTMALSSVVLGLLREAGAPMWLAVVAALAVGTAAGALNGVFIGRLRVHPLLVTLATLAAYRGLAEGVSHGRPISGFPAGFLELGGGTLLGIPTPLLLLIPAALLAWFVASRTVWGSWVYALGGNERAAIYCAIPVGRVKFALYTLSGAAAGLCAVVFAARRNTAKADVGSGIELEVITAVVLGGTSIFGGRGTILGTVLGVVLVHELREFVGWRWGHDEIILIVIGATLIGSVLLTNLGSRSKA